MNLVKNLACLSLVSLAVSLAGCGGAAATATPTRAARGSQQAASAPTSQPAPATEAAVGTVPREGDATATSASDDAASPTPKAPSDIVTPTREAVSQKPQNPTPLPAKATKPPAPEPTSRPARARDTRPAPQPESAYTGTVVGDSGAPVAQAWVYAGDTLGRTDADGRFKVRAPEGVGTLTAMAPGYKKYVAPLKARDAGTIRLQPFVAKAVYVSGVGDLSVRDRFYKLLDDTELNAIVINVKNDDGKVWTSQVPLAQSTGASYEDFVLSDFVKEAHRRGIYVIGRFTTFRDPTLSEARPDMAVHSTSGGIWADNQGHRWVDPFNRKVWDYFGDLGEEIASSGIDEIQFDYVRFPVDGDLSTVEYQRPSTHINRPETIDAFLEYMEGRLRPHKVFISADTFGLTVWSAKEQGTGQLLSLLTKHLDYYSPMIYPDHFAAGTAGFEIPSAHPYQIIYQSVEKAQAKLKGTPVIVRPYLSAFRDTQYGQPMGLVQFLAQKRAAEDAGASGWVYWNAALTYDPDTFRREKR